MEQTMRELQERIGYTFHRQELLKSALMHSSYTNETHLPKYKCNERLEFLGDAVLELVSSEFLFFVTFLQKKNYMDMESFMRK